MKNKLRSKGAFHVHSNYSKDGNCSIEALAQKSRALGYDFLVVTEHFEDMNELQLQNLIEDCTRLTEIFDGLKIIPGIEIRLKNKAHVLVIGLQAPLTSSDVFDIQSLQKSVKAKGALVGVAHLGHESKLTLEELKSFDFIEAWNSRYNKRFPSFKSLKMAQGVQESCILGGLDLHFIDEFGPLWVEIEAENIIEAIKFRKITTRSSIMALDSRGCIIKGKIACYTLYLPWLCAEYFTSVAARLFALIKIKPPYFLKKFKKRLIG